MKKLIQSIIKEYAGNINPIVPRRSSAPARWDLEFDANEKEVQDKYFRVSKQEESQALNFIRNRFMDYAIGLFKLQYSYGSFQKGEHGALSVDVVNKQLKKISEEKFPQQRKKDIIQYSAPLIKNFKLTVNIFKNEDGDLAIGYNNPLNHVVKYFLVNGPEHLTPMYEIDAPKPINENFPTPQDGFNDKGMPKWRPEELYQHFHRITKQEADEVLAYIKRTIVPPIVNKYNKWAVKEDVVTVEQVNASLRKVRQEPYPMSINTKETMYDLVVWRADLPISNDGIASFVFFTFRYYARQLFVGVRNPLSATIEIYRAFSDPPYKQDIKTRLEYNPDFLKEAVEYDWHITKQEEAKALQFIRNSVFPQALGDYNEAAAERKVPFIHYGPEERSVIDSLRKVRHTEFPEHKTDQILYIADFKGWQWVFIIEKNGLGSTIPHIRAGYIDDLWNQSKMYDINIPRPEDPVKKWQEPRSAFKKITDYMPHQKGGFPGLTNWKKKKDDLSESYGQHNLRLSKKEEAEAFELLKRQFYTTQAHKTLKKIGEIRSENPLHVSDKIIYAVSFADNNIVDYFAVGKRATTGQLVYFSCEKDGKRISNHEIALDGSDFPENESIEESYQSPNLHISKAEEVWALQQLRKRRNSQGEPIGKYLKKIEHTVSTDPQLSDRIKYKNTDDATTYTIVKSRLDGRLGYCNGYIAFKLDKSGRRLPDNYESSTIDDFEVPLHEAKRPIRIFQRTKYATPSLQHAFAQVHNQQRFGGPESMFNERVNPDVEFGNGVWRDSLEHGGDLVHRASYAGTSEDFGGGGVSFGRGATLEKAERLLRRYTSAYGFARDVAEQIANNYHYNVEEGKFHGSLEEYQNRVKAAGERYAQAYEKIQPITLIQKLGRDVAIDTGRFQFDKAVPKLRALVKLLNSPNWEKYYWTPLKGTLIKEYVTPPWPKAVLTKKDEARAIQFIKMVLDREMRARFPNTEIEKSFKKISIIPSETPNNCSDRSVYQVIILPQNLEYKFEIYFSNRLGLMVLDPVNYKRYYVTADGPESSVEEIITESKQPELVLDKKSEARAVQFIKGIKDRENDSLLYNKSLRKIFNQPSANTESMSSSAWYEAITPNNEIKRFRIFKHHKFGLIVRDDTDAVVYKLDMPNPYTAPFSNRFVENTEEEDEPQYCPELLRITKNRKLKQFNG